MAVTVLSGPERRRRWTSAQKLRVVEETLRLADKVSDIARRHDIHPNLLHAWRRQARQGELRVAEASPAVAFTPVAIAARDPATASAALVGIGRAQANGMIEIELAAGERLRITGVVETSLAIALIKTLARSRRRR